MNKVVFWKIVIDALNLRGFTSCGLTGKRADENAEAIEEAKQRSYDDIVPPEGC
jgi:hypothetical protein